MTKLNKNAFTLVELLAVIVIFAIILGIAATRVVATINKSRTDSFVSSYKMVIKAVNNRLQLGEADITALTCNNTATCASIYDLDISPEEYDLKVAKSNDNLIVTMAGTSGGKFEDIKLTTSDVEDSFSIYNNGKDNTTDNNSIGTMININNGNTSLVTDSNDDNIKEINRVMEKYLSPIECDAAKYCSTDNNNIKIISKTYTTKMCKSGSTAFALSLKSGYKESDGLKFNDNYYNINMNNNYCYADQTSYDDNLVFTCINNETKKINTSFILFFLIT